MKITNIKNMQELLDLYYKGGQNGVYLNNRFYCTCGEVTFYEKSCSHCGNKKPASGKIDSPLNRRTVIETFEDKKGFKAKDMKLFVERNYNDELVIREKEINSFTCTVNDNGYADVRQYGRDGLSKGYTEDIVREVKSHFPEVEEIYDFYYPDYYTNRKLKDALEIIYKYPNLFASRKDVDIFNIYRDINRINDFNVELPLHEALEVKKPLLKVANSFRLDELKKLSSLVTEDESEILVPIIDREGRYGSTYIISILELGYKVEDIEVTRERLSRYYNKSINIIHSFIMDYRDVYGRLPDLKTLKSNKDFSKLKVISKMNNKFNFSEDKIEKFFKELNQNPMKAIENMGFDEFDFIEGF